MLLQLAPPSDAKVTPNPPPGGVTALVLSWVASSASSDPSSLLFESYHPTPTGAPSPLLPQKKKKKNPGHAGRAAPPSVAEPSPSRGFFLAPIRLDPVLGLQENAIVSRVPRPGGVDEAQVESPHELIESLVSPTAPRGRRSEPLLPRHRPCSAPSAPSCGPDIAICRSQTPARRCCPCL